VIRITQDQFNIAVDFWDAIPGLKGIPSLEPYLKMKHSSAIMWGAIHHCHPESPLYHYVGKEDEIKIMVESMGVKDYNFEDYKDLTDILTDLATTELERTMSFYENKLRERREFISNIPYELSTADQLDKMMMNSIKMSEAYSKLQKTVREEADFSAKMSESDTDEL